MKTLFTNLALLAVLSGLCLFCTALAICGCNWSKDYWTDSYIQMYLEIDGFYFRQNSLGAFKFISGHGKTGAFNDSGEDKAWFDEVCAANGDLTFGRKIYLVLGIPNILAYTPDLASIDVVCNDFYDSDHQAGASLNDCITISYTAAGDYIRSGYQGPLPATAKKLLSELEQKDLAVLLVVPRCELDFVVKPEELAVHSMTIRMDMSDGQEYVGEFKYDFASGSLAPGGT